MRWRLQRSGEFNVCYFYTAFSGSFVVLFPGKASVELRPMTDFLLCLDGVLGEDSYL